ncbi:hypothetical protein [Lactococcus garvieae]|uniref:hypothetical protein n=1 Tax=Lactococcus garvieae TaxID=1363 RepID=UPI0002EF4E32|nr:hypothetical protein [Lactococcus garvieae]
MISIESPELSKVIVNNAKKVDVFRVTSMRKVFKRTQSGDVIEGAIEKVTAQGVETKIAEMMEKNGADPKQLKPITLELIGSEEDLHSINPEDFIGTDIPVENADVMLKWEQGFNGNGGWRGLKLVLNLSDKVSVQEGKENGK